MEQRIEEIETDVPHLFTSHWKHDKLLQTLIDKVDDLENHSRRNNLRIIGLPESYTLQQLQDISSHKIPRNLGLKQTCITERIGPPKTDRTSPSDCEVFQLR